MRSEPRAAKRARQGAPLGLAILVLLTALGCGDNLAQVAGSVTIDGEPLRGSEQIHATVLFQPASGQGATAAALVDADGNYRLSTGSQQGVQPGEYLVTCSATEIVPAADSGGTPSGRRLTDPKYANAQTSGLSFTVEPGDNQCDIPLQSLRTSTAAR